VRNHYAADFKDRRKALFRPAQSSQEASHGRRFGASPRQGSWPGGRRPRLPQGATEATRGSLLARGGLGLEAACRGRESAILMTCLNHPVLIERHESALTDLPIVCADLDKLRTRIISVAAAPQGSASDAQGLAERLMTATGEDPRDTLMRGPHLREFRFARADAPLEAADTGLVEAMTRQAAALARVAESADAERDLVEGFGEAITPRLQAVVEAQREADQGATGEAQDDDEATRAKLRAFFDNPIWVKRT
jgi:hypothetical protein